MLDVASVVLPHICNQRCQKRIGPGSGPENFICRKPNNLLLSPDNTRNMFLKLPNNHSFECVQRHRQVGLVEPPRFDAYGIEAELKSSHTFFIHSVTFLLLMLLLI